MKLVVVFVTLVSVVSPAAVQTCPKLCKCEFDKTFIAAKCSSQKFLQKLDDKQANSIKQLDLSNTSLYIIDKKLKKLKNLEVLDLSHNEISNIQQFPSLNKLTKLSLARNHLKNFTFSSLPKELKDLDLSSNYILDLPKDWYTLHQLSIIHLFNNPVNCDDKAIDKYVNLVNVKISIAEDVFCHSPKNLAGKKLQVLIADALMNPMLSDQEEKVESEEDVEDEFIKHTTEKVEKTTKEIKENLFEGSGDEGSGDYDKEIPPACVIDCSTFKPLQISKENDTSPLLSIKNQVDILIEDLFGKEQKEETTIPTDKSSTVAEEIISKKTVKLPMSGLPNQDKETEKLVVNHAEHKNTDDLERASLGSEEDGSTYYLIGTVIILMIAVAIFIIIKKKSRRGKNRKRNSLSENGICEEMKPLGKYKEISNGTNAEKKEDNLRPEIVPLMNGQNGRGDLPSSQADSMEDIDVTLRLPSDGSSPLPERVTITTSEIPPTVLRTPQLVHRSINGDGEIITKPLDDSY